jgi:hypothetical protein
MPPKAAKILSNGIAFRIAGLPGYLPASASPLRAYAGVFTRAPTVRSLAQRGLRTINMLGSPSRDAFTMYAVPDDKSSDSLSGIANSGQAG